jgi:hypothetical protein
MNENLRQRQTLTLSDLATIYGCCGLFDMCADEDLVSLSMQGADPFLDWVGWEATDVCVVKKEFITWIRPEQSGGVCTDGYLADPCEDPEGVEFGTCDFTLEDFARLRREGPVRDVTMNDVRYCDRQPRYRLDGTRITDDREFDARMIAEVQLQDLRRMIITGNAATAGQFSGLEHLVVNNYTNSAGRRCAIMDSMVIDWNHNGMAGGAGITYNGHAIAATWNFVDVLLDAWRRVRQRIMYSPTLAAQLGGGIDAILLMPTFLTRCLLDHFTCWSVCDGSQYNEVALQSFEARTFRNSLLGGRFGNGKIMLDGFEIPLLGYDWELIGGPHCGDIYLLVGAVGAVKTLMGQYLNMNTVPGAYPEADYSVSDGGRFLRWVQRDHTCVQQIAEIRPRVLSWAPWTNIRFEDVCCDSPTGPLSPDPCETSFFPETSFSVAECP